jgi:hypothetical protein
VEDKAYVDILSKANLDGLKHLESVLANSIQVASSTGDPKHAKKILKVVKAEIKARVQKLKRIK